MKIGIDARFYGAIGKGLGRYTQKLLEHLEIIDHENQYVVFLRKENFSDYSPKNKNFSKALADYHWYSFSEQILFPVLLLRHGLDMVHFPHFNVPILYRKKFIVTIHDLILIHFPTVRNTTLSPWWYHLKFLAYKVCIRRAICGSRHIMTVSHFTKQDICNLYGINGDRVSVAYEAADDFCFYSQSRDEEILQKYAILKPYILYVGNAYPHKNLENLIAALPLIREHHKDIQLVLVGKHDYFYHRLIDLAKREGIPQVIFPGFVPDMDLSVLYRQCSLYVFPSLYEGFGLPPLEAMNVGAPVLASDRACLKEVLGDGAEYMHSLDAAGVCNAVVALLRDDSRRREMVKRGYARARSFHWNEMAKKTLEQYKNQK